MGFAAVSRGQSHSAGVLVRNQPTAATRTHGCHEEGTQINVPHLGTAQGDLGGTGGTNGKHWCQNKIL